MVGGLEVFSVFLSLSSFFHFPFSEDLDFLRVPSLSPFPPSGRGQIFLVANLPLKSNPRREFHSDTVCTDLGGTGDSQRDSRESFAIDNPIFTARQADSPESLKFPIRANHPIRGNRVRIDSRESRH